MSYSYKNFGKRLFDICGAVGLGLLVLPCMMIAILAIRLTMKGPVFYTQLRVGRQGRLFRLYKLRSMPVNPDRRFYQSGPDDPHVTPVGRLLRRFKIDEVPQLLNVIRGDMSLVGPRPYLPEVCAALPTGASARMAVRPGLTGWAQVNGNVFLSPADRLSFDTRYVRKVCFWLDSVIVLKTILVVLGGEDRFHIGPKTRTITFKAPQTCDHDGTPARLRVRSV